MSAALAVMAPCHPKRKMLRDGQCRECWQVATSPADDPLPAMIAGCEQAGGPEIPPRCGKCGSAWIDEGTYVRCYACGGTWHLTSTRVLARPKTTERQMQAWRALRGRRDRER